MHGHNQDGEAVLSNGSAGKEYVLSGLLARCSPGQAHPDLLIRKGGRSRDANARHLVADPGRIVDRNEFSQAKSDHTRPKLRCASG
jgi:hypothetical protein